MNEKEIIKKKVKTHKFILFNIIFIIIHKIHTKSIPQNNKQN